MWSLFRQGLHGVKLSQDKLLNMHIWRAGKCTATCSCGVQVNVQQHAFCGADGAAGQSTNGCSDGLMMHTSNCMHHDLHTQNGNDAVSPSVSFMQPVQVKKWVERAV
jgi:hypothetical protein